MLNTIYTEDVLLHIMYSQDSNDNTSTRLRIESGSCLVRKLMKQLGYKGTQQLIVNVLISKIKAFNNSNCIMQLRNQVGELRYPLWI